MNEHKFLMMMKKITASLDRRVLVATVTIMVTLLVLSFTVYVLQIQAEQDYLANKGAIHDDSISLNNIAYALSVYSGNYSKGLKLIDKALAIAPDDIYYMDTKAVSSGQFIAQLSTEKTVYNITEDQLPFTIPIGLTVSGAKFPYSQVVTTNPTEGVKVNIFGSSPISVTVTKPQTFTIILNVVDADNKQAFNTKTITVNVVPALPAEDKDPDGIAIPFRRTGLVVPLLTGSDHPNGQRYSVNHHFKNYMMIGYFKIGKDQDTLEMKTDGPNHSRCKQLPQCTWIEADLSLRNRSITYDNITRNYKAGQFYFSSEFPYPYNHVAPSDAMGPVLQSVPKAGDWVGFSVAAFENIDGFRRIQIRYDGNPFDSYRKPANNWVLQLDKTDIGQITNPDLAKRTLPINYNKGLEAEVRCAGATHHDSEIKWAKIYEIIPA